ncbi:hypothetical protein [Geobacter sp. SVR]|uniref:hypothetical protein n=1 Tax=Geobacter sp. SVR TaxID=2495594 RepID=UPI00143EF559|nr:hypothetical protein [Geobacter sp. SVR]BCS54070.1 hypothetical protein GSVR_23780 [Geobacter sp. SVR]GCF87553.1 hypothetical protein GSbR_41530 [Geobacter sp. SVR]
MKKLSKAEARIQRNIEKLAKTRDKNVRLSENIRIEDKYIRVSEAPSLEKNPRSTNPDNYKTCYFSWCHTRSDTAGDWGWNESRLWTDQEYSETIKPHMDAHRNDSWNEVETKTYSGRFKYRKLLNKYQPLDSLCGEAQTRWGELEGLAEFETLFRLRLGDKKRIWGIRLQHHFFMIWYERNHKICPVDNH